MKKATTTQTNLTAKEELAQLRAKFLRQVPATKEDTDSQISVPTVIGAAIDHVDHAANVVNEALTGDNNFFTRVNVARMKHKAARGGYAK